MLSVSVLIPAILLAVNLVQHPIPPSAWQAAGREVRRIPPRDFKQLPPGIVSQLERMNCAIPQRWDHLPDQPLQNVISGEFARKGQRDWAVLCSAAGKSWIQVFWGGPEKCAARVGESDDFLQEVEPGKIGYARQIAAADEKNILHYQKENGGPPPPRITHLGIDDGFGESGSTVRYCQRGRWLELMGGD